MNEKLHPSCRASRRQDTLFDIRRSSVSPPRPPLLRRTGVDFAVVKTRFGDVMNKAVLETIQSALKSSDGRAADWLQKIEALQKAPENRAHLKSLEGAKTYLKDLLRPFGTTSHG